MKVFGIPSPPEHPPQIIGQADQEYRKPDDSVKPDEEEHECWALLRDLRKMAGNWFPGGFVVEFVELFTFLLV